MERSTAQIKKPNQSAHRPDLPSAGPGFFYFFRFFQRNRKTRMPENRPRFSRPRFPAQNPPVRKPRSQNAMAEVRPGLKSRPEPPPVPWYNRLYETPAPNHPPLAQASPACRLVAPPAPRRRLFHPLTPFPPMSTKGHYWCQHCDDTAFGVVCQQCSNDTIWVLDEITEARKPVAHKRTSQPQTSPPDATFEELALTNSQTPDPRSKTRPRYATIEYGLAMLQKAREAVAQAPEYKHKPE